jgi:hypothetical protein
VTISLIAASTAVAAYSQYQAGQSEAKVADANARLADRNASDVRQLGAAQAGQLREKGAQVEGEQKVALASSGVDVSSGSAANLFATTASTAEVDALTARNNAAKRAWGFDVEAATDRARASLARRKSFLGPLGSILGSAGQIAGMKGLGGSGGGAVDL